MQKPFLHHPLVLAVVRTQQRADGTAEANARLGICQGVDYR
jgi:hypothetical protein